MDRGALQRLEVLVGRWGLDVRFEQMPDAPFSGSADIHWLLGSTFLTMTSEVSHPQAPDTHTARRGPSRASSPTSVRSTSSSASSGRSSTTAT